jgi:hypothetical protein
VLVDLGYASFKFLRDCDKHDVRYVIRLKDRMGEDRPVPLASRTRSELAQEPVDPRPIAGLKDYAGPAQAEEGAHCFNSLLTDQAWTAAIPPELASFIRQCCHGRLHQIHAASKPDQCGPIFCRNVPCRFHCPHQLLLTAGRERFGVGNEAFSRSGENGRLIAQPFSIGFAHRELGLYRSLL